MRGCGSTTLAVALAAAVVAAHLTTGAAAGAGSDSSVTAASAAKVGPVLAAGMSAGGHYRSCCIVVRGGASIGTCSESLDRSEECVNMWNHHQPMKSLLPMALGGSVPFALHKSVYWKTAAQSFGQIDPQTQRWH